LVPGLVNTFLSWELFSPLARLSYMAYLIHYYVLMIFFCSANYAMELSNLMLVRVRRSIFRTFFPRNFNVNHENSVESNFSAEFFLSYLIHIYVCRCATC
jgi:hypothetical protein